MPYKFALERVDYSYLASGKVFHALPGYPAFPIRLASEIFQRCLALRAAGGAAGRVTVYDPCCGGAYLLATLACLQGASIDSIFASDIEPQAVDLARRNLELLTAGGLDRRIGELTEMWNTYGKESHQSALRSAGRLREQILSLTLEHPIATRVFAADALDGTSLRDSLQGARVDLVITDVPYGRHSEWKQTTGADQPPEWRMLEALRGILSPGALAAVAAEKGRKVAHEAYTRVQKFQIGKRQVVILQPVGLP
jgi:23S rRNA (guanine2535-N1)-methyltransferase